MKISPPMAVLGFLLLVALSVLVQLAVAKWRYEKKQAQKRLEAAQQKRR